MCSGTCVAVRMSAALEYVHKVQLQYAVTVWEHDYTDSYSYQKCIGVPEHIFEKKLNTIY